jgi:hypothetical protein
VHRPMIQERAPLISAAEPSPFLRFIAELRDETAQARSVEWHAHLEEAVDLRPLYHLYPPSSPPDATVLAWRRSFRPGQRYYRRGPDFVVIYDNRSDAGQNELVLAAPEAVTLFERLHDPGPVDPDDKVASALTEAGVLFCLGGLAVMPVCRLRRLILPRNML